MYAILLLVCGENYASAENFREKLLEKLEHKN